MNEYGIVLLAAGSSSRLGKLKQTLPYGDSTLLDHSVLAALSSIATKIIVVTNKSLESHQHTRHEKLVEIINEDPAEGMASSIRLGLQTLVTTLPEVNAVLFMACDQPYVDTMVLDNLVTLHKKTGKNIVASKYGGSVGIPAVFSKPLFPALLALQGDAGAKKIILQYPGEIDTFSFPLGNIDIDTAADYEQLQIRSHKP